MNMLLGIFHLKCLLQTSAILFDRVGEMDFKVEGSWNTEKYLSALFPYTNKCVWGVGGVAWPQASQCPDGCRWPWLKSPHSSTQKQPTVVFL